MISRRFMEFSLPHSSGRPAALARPRVRVRHRIIGFLGGGGAQMERVLVTGAAGGIGSRLRKLLKGAYPDMRWSDINTPSNLAQNEKFVRADLSVMSEVENAVRGVEGIVHLGGWSTEGPWETILNANIIGCYNLFEAARRARVERIVFASSNHAVGFYPRQRKIG